MTHLPFATYVAIKVDNGMFYNESKIHLPLLKQRVIITEPKYPVRCRLCLLRLACRNFSFRKLILNTVISSVNMQDIL